MSKTPDTKPISSKCKEKIDSLVVERQYTIGRRLLKITLKMLVVLFIFSLGFILSELRFTDRADQMDNSYQFASVFVFDTEQKIEDFYRMFERDFSDENGLSSESHEVKEYMAMVRELQGRPLVTVGPFSIFVNNDGDRFSVHETQSVNSEGGRFLPLVELEISEQSKRLIFVSSQEKGGRLPRFYVQCFYSGDGIYNKGIFAVHGENGSPERIFFDTKGLGVFDMMYIFENGEMIKYRLNNLSWEQIDTDESIDKLQVVE